MAKFSDASVRAALSGRFGVRRCFFPGSKDVEMGIRLLTDAEMDSVRLEAQQHCLKNKADLAIDPEFFDRALFRELVSRAFVDLDKQDEPFFSSMKEVAELDPVTVRALFDLYGTFQQESDPYLYCSEDEVEKVVEVLGKSESSVGLLNLYDAPTLRSFVLSMARKLRETLPTPK